MERLTFSYHSCKKYLPYGEKFSRDKIFADSPLAKIFAKKFLRFDDRKAMPTLGVANHTHTTRESAVMASEFSVWCVDTTFMRYIWDATVSEEQPSQRESDIINCQRHRGTA